MDYTLSSTKGFKARELGYVIYHKKKGACSYCMEKWMKFLEIIKTRNNCSLGRLEELEKNGTIDIWW